METIIIDLLQKEYLVNQLWHDLEVDVSEFIKIDNKWVGLYRYIEDLVMLQRIKQNDGSFKVVITYYEDIFVNYETNVNYYSEINLFKNKYGDKYNQIIDDFNSFINSPLNI